MKNFIKNSLKVVLVSCMHSLFVMQCICDFGSNTTIFQRFQLFYAFLKIMRLLQHAHIEILLYCSEIQQVRFVRFVTDGTTTLVYMYCTWNRPYDTPHCQRAKMKGKKNQHTVQEVFALEKQCEKREHMLYVLFYPSFFRHINTNPCVEIGACVDNNMTKL